LLFALAQEYTKDENYEIDEEELISLEQRRTDRLSGKSKTYSWEEAKKAVLNSGKLEQLIATGWISNSKPLLI